MSEKSLKKDLASLVSGTVDDAPAVLEEFSGDYGGIFKQMPRMVVRPASAEELARVVAYCYEQDLQMSARAGGFSFAGQALNEDGVILDLRDLNEIGAVHAEDGWVDVQAGAQWQSLVRQTAPGGWLPPTLTSYVRTSVGGTLSAAGFGMSSARYGTQIDHCLELDIVHHSGEIVRCSEDENRELFEHVLGGFGQFGFMTRARQRLRPVAANTRSYFLQYDDLEAHLADQVRLVKEKRIQFIDAMLRPCYHGLRVVNGRRVPFHSYLYPMNITVEANDLDTIDDEEVLAGLNYSQWVYREDLSIEDFLLLGHTDQHVSPKIAEVFVDVLVPWSRLEEFIRKVQAHILPLIVHVEHTILWPMTRETLSRPMLRTPDEDMFMGIGLYSRVPKSAGEQTVAASRAFVDLAMQMGGTYYLTGSVRFDADRFAKQFGDLWPAVREVKHRYDPKGLYNRGLFVWPEE